jgi:acetyl-CoA acyltransferase
MPDAVVVAACRTAIATSGRGSLTRTTAQELAHVVVGEAVRRSGLPGELVDEVILGESMYGGGDIARHAAITTGLEHVAGTAVNRHCASSLASLSLGAASIRSTMAEVVVVGGVESRSTAPVESWRRPGTDEWVTPWMSPSHPDRADAPNTDMSITVGWNAAQRAGVSREEMDAWALRSHARAVAAIDEGRFVDEIVPIDVPQADGTTRPFAVDEHPRRDTSAAKLASLEPLHPEIPGFSITAGNSCGINDGAGALVLASDAAAARADRPAMATVRSWAAVGVDPAETGLAPVAAVAKALRRAAVATSEVDLWEINEAFASMCVATTRLLDIDEERVNVSGSGCSLGHPVAATGARMVTTLVYELGRRGGGIGVAAMCAGGGMGSAVVLDVAAASSW